MRRKLKKFSVISSREHFITKKMNVKTIEIYIQ